MSEAIKMNIRVYSLIINNKHEVLLSDEFRLKQNMTKFPGGGLIPGEGTIDCIHREALEEFNQECFNLIPIMGACILFRARLGSHLDQ